MTFPLPDRRDVLRWLIGALYIVAGLFHLLQPEPFIRITPDWVPFDKLLLIYATGLAELAGAGMLVSGFRFMNRIGAVGLAIYAVCVWPANFNHMLLDLASNDGGWGLSLHVPRLAAQPVLIWATLWSARLTNWPFGRRVRPDRDFANTQDE